MFQSGRRSRDARGFTLLEAAIALVTLAALSAAGVAASRQAQVEFNNNQNRFTLQNLASAAASDAMARGSRFDEALLQSYLDGRSNGVGGVMSIAVGATAESQEPGQVVAVLSEDRLVLSLAMRSSRGRCLRIQVLAGTPGRVASQQVSVCRALAPEAILSSSAVLPSAPVLLQTVQSGSITTVSWIPVPEAAAYVVSTSPESSGCAVLAPQTSCDLELSFGEYLVFIEAQNAAGSSVSTTVIQVPQA